MKAYAQYYSVGQSVAGCAPVLEPHVGIWTDWHFRLLNGRIIQWTNHLLLRLSDKAVHILERKGTKIYKNTKKIQFFLGTVFLHKDVSNYISRQCFLSTVFLVCQKGINHDVVKKGDPCDYCNSRLSGLTRGLCSGAYAQVSCSPLCHSPSSILGAIPRLRLSFTPPNWVRSLQRRLWT